MASHRPAQSFGALVTIDAAVLVLGRPKWSAVFTGLRRLRTWVGTTGADAAIAQLVTAAVWIVAAWLAVGLVAALMAAFPGAVGRRSSMLADRILPAALRRLVAGFVGVAVVLTPAMASAVRPVGPAAHPGVTAPAGVDRTRAADQAVSAPPTAPVPWPTSPPVEPPGPQDGEVAVRPGDSLWLIAAHRLGAHPTDAEIAAAWPAWYRANAAVIGPDADLIRPGQHLVVPAPAALRPPT